MLPKYLWRSQENVRAVQQMCLYPLPRNVSLGTQDRHLHWPESIQDIVRRKKICNWTAAILASAVTLIIGGAVMGNLWTKTVSLMVFYNCNLLHNVWNHTQKIFCLNYAVKYSHFLQSLYTHTRIGSSCMTWPLLFFLLFLVFICALYSRLLLCNCCTWFVACCGWINFTTHIKLLCIVDERNYVECGNTGFLLWEVILVPYSISIPLLCCLPLLP
jgi:hypothetical protein